MLTRVLNKAIDLIRKENAALRCRNFVLDPSTTDRKNVVLFELEHIGRSVSTIDERTRSLMVELRGLLADNRLLLGVRLDAAREVGKLIDELATDHLSDGTYQIPTSAKSSR